MHFTLAQIAAMLVPLAMAMVLIVLWYQRDAQADCPTQQENLLTLFSVFFWGVAGCFLVKIFVDLVFQLDQSQLIFPTTGFYILTIFGEELVKAFSLILGLELAEKRFNEVSDGLVYGAVAALGFVFLESVFYLWSSPPSLNFWMLLSGRYLTAFPIHLLTTAFFGITYSAAYLGFKRYAADYARQFRISAVKITLLKPYFLLAHLKEILLRGNFFRNSLKFLVCWDLGKRIYFLLTRQTGRLLHKERFLVFPSVFILEGFLAAFYLHLLLNQLLLQPTFSKILVIILPLLGFSLYLGFYLLDREPRER